MGSPEIHEICRSCQEFYPDPETRQKVHYLFAHRFLPEYFFFNPRGVVGSVYVVRRSPQSQSRIVQKLADRR